MHSIYRNGNGGAVIFPPTPKVVVGRSLVHRRLNKRQRACLAANYYDGLMRVVPTQRQAADMFGVSLSHMRNALALHPDVRVPANVRPRVSTKVHTITDSELVSAIRKIGIDRVLAAACVAEAAAE